MNRQQFPRGILKFADRHISLKSLEIKTKCISNNMTNYVLAGLAVNFQILLKIGKIFEFLIRKS